MNRAGFNDWNVLNGWNDWTKSSSCSNSSIGSKLQKRFDGQNVLGEVMIFGRHSVLKRGCSTWDPEQVPQSEFQTRLDAVSNEKAQRNLDALVIYGDNYS